MGPPRIDGRRIRVQDVAVQAVHHKLPPERIADEFDLSLGEVHAALSYYYDHQAEIDADIEAADRAIDDGAKRNPAKIRELLGD